ncbi:MAG TPA: hypothetical protein VGG28_33140 [Kofleriaceae bacterium]
MADTEWAVVANVRAEAFGRTRSPGTRHFSAGALLWCLDIDGGSGGERLRVIGHHRVSKRRIAIVIARRYLVNFRVKLAYAAPVVRAIRDHRAQRDEAACRQLAAGWAAASPPIDDLHARAQLLSMTLRLISADDEGRVLADRATALLAKHGAASPTTPELEVLGDWLEDRGAGIPIDELAMLLARRRDNP